MDTYARWVPVTAALSPLIPVNVEVGEWGSPAYGHRLRFRLADLRGCAHAVVPFGRGGFVHFDSVFRRNFESYQDVLDAASNRVNYWHNLGTMDFGREEIERARQFYPPDCN